MRKNRYEKGDRVAVKADVYKSSRAVKKLIGIKAAEPRKKSKLPGSERKEGAVYMENKKEYSERVARHSPASPVAKNCLFAFLIGGGICAAGQLLFFLYNNILSASTEDAYTLVTVSLIFIAVLITGFGIFDNIAGVAGAGTLVPVTGFANAVVSPAIDTKAEGLVVGVGANIFKVAGPVILFTTLAGTLYGVIEYMISLFM